MLVMGKVSESDLASAYRRARLLVVPSRYEGLGSVALEAMAAGTPVLATDVPGLTDLQGEGWSWCRRRTRPRCSGRPEGFWVPRLAGGDVRRGPPGGGRALLLGRRPTPDRRGLSLGAWLQSQPGGVGRLQLGPDRLEPPQGHPARSPVLKVSGVASWASRSVRSFSNSSIRRSVSLRDGAGGAAAVRGLRAADLLAGRPRAGATGGVEDRRWNSRPDSIS